MPGWLNPFDVLIVFSVLVGTVLGFVRGLLRMILALAVLYVAAVLGLTLHRPFGNWLIYIFGLPQSISLGLAFLLIVIVTSAIINFVLKLTYKDTELPGIDGIERVLGINEAANAALLLRLGDHVQSKRGLARRFRPVNLDDASAREPANAKRDVEAKRAG